MQTEVWWGQAEFSCGSLSSGGRFCGVAFWQESGFSHSEDLWTFNSVYEDFYKCCTLSATCKYDFEINCVTLQYKAFNSGQP
jgi:hypothetical protein